MKSKKIPETEHNVGDTLWKILNNRIATPIIKKIKIIITTDKVEEQYFDHTNTLIDMPYFKTKKELIEHL